MPTTATTGCGSGIPLKAVKLTKHLTPTATGKEVIKSDKQATKDAMAAIGTTTATENLQGRHTIPQAR